MTTTLCAAGVTMAFVVMASVSARAAEPIGVWIANEGRAQIKVEPCGSHVCGTIVWLAEPRDPDTGKPKLDKNNPDSSLRSRPIIGLRILDAQPEHEKQWHGTIYNGENGQTYNVTLRAEGAALKVEGCVLGGLICRTQTWTRLSG